jgi:hypothetical protein
MKKVKCEKIKLKKVVFKRDLFFNLLEKQHFLYFLYKPSSVYKYLVA